MATPSLGQFLVAINGFVKAGNASEISNYLALEPPFNQQYYAMIEELRKTHPKGQEQGLEDKCAQYLTAADGWSNFARFMVQYFVYLRDISDDQSQYLATYERLLELQTKVNAALGQSSQGTLLLQTVITNARLLCRLAIGLDKQPDLIAHLKSAARTGEDSGQRETLPERAANTVRTAFVTCLNDRAEMVGGKPKGKQAGIYILANLCLKVLFQCRKTRNAVQIFENISNAAPPLAAYPRSQRVTYLYYLGRFLFQSNDFYRAQLALQAAYNLAPAISQTVRQRRLILVYLVTANIILGRFPTETLLSRPEAEGFGEHFLPLCYAIRQGNRQAFDRYFDPDGPHFNWLVHYRVCFQLQNRCEVLIWRSLLRKVFQLYGSKPTPESRIAAQLDLNQALDAFASVEPPADDYIDPDLEEAEEDFSTDYQSLDMSAIESKVSSLIDQGFVSGYIAHARQRLAILGGHKAAGDHVKAGFPIVWHVVSKKSSDEVPGWKQETSKAANPFAGAGPGMVFKFSNLRPIGAAG
ncbi:hypothetical protein AMS68_000419 [Peltaster fructicola]|uniref:PCI domain-containing protein n=1 Tax=Peltaster fructicola TaxID=286661 RepID=A0A6H0XJL1_9PEZI|nr:hypothetical protein AMS68_000419 [Peltaster fructicola]